MRVLLGIVLHRPRRAAVAVAFAQNRVHGRALDRVIARADRLFLVGRGFFGVVRNVVALRLQLFDGCHQLRDRSRDVGQFDDIRIRRLHQLAQSGQIIGDALRVCQVLGEGRQNTARQRNILGANTDTRRRGKLANDGQKRRAGQFRRFVYNGIQYVEVRFICHILLPFLSLSGRAIQELWPHYRGARGADQLYLPWVTLF